MGLINSRKHYEIRSDATNIIIDADRDITIYTLKNGNLKVSDTNYDAKIQIQVIDARKRENKKKPVKPCLKYPVDTSKEFNGSDSDFNYLDSLYAIDTNYRVLDEVKNIKLCVMVSGEIKLKSVKKYQEGGSFVHGASYIYFTRHEKPELLGLHWLISDIVKTHVNLSSMNIGIITDSEFEKLDQFNIQKIPYLEGYFIPKSINLIYAAADSCGERLPNKMIRICDKGGRQVFKSLTNLDIAGQVQLGDKLFHVHKKILWE